MNDHTPGYIPFVPVVDMESIETVAPRRSSRLASRMPTPAVTKVAAVKKTVSKKRAVSSAATSPVIVEEEPVIRVVNREEDVEIPPPPSVSHHPQLPVVTEPITKVKKTFGRKKKEKSIIDGVTEADVHSFIRSEGMQSQRRVKMMIAEAFSSANQKRIAFIVLRSAIKSARDNKRKRVMVRDVEPALSAVLEVLSLLVIKETAE